ncbi:MAG: TrbG/VirB9 family P-type conjugative transfer protein [Novosphingobium sp.]
MKLLLAPILLLLANPTSAHAEGRSQEFSYSPNHVYTLIGQRAIQTLIQFAEDETIENIALGDAAAWQVTPNKRANMLFIKPLYVNGRTNMTVVTNRRRYLFDLRIVGPKGHAIYAIQFVYPDDQMAGSLLARRAEAAPASNVESETPAPLPEPEVNTSWGMSGDRKLRPARIYDDGEATYVAWSASTELPGIFSFGDDGKEGPVNFTVRGDYLVIDGVAPRYVLRRGKARTMLTNLAPRPPKPVAETASASEAMP